MGMYKQLRKLWEKPQGASYKNNLMTWRQEGVVTRLDAPTRLDRAHQIGYKAKPGVVVARVAIKRGSRKRPRPSGGRKPSHAGQYKYTTAKSDQVLAEEKANKRFTNLEVVNSYWVGEDGTRKWFEIVLVDPENPHIKADKQLSKISQRRGRAFRGLTSAGRKSRGVGRGKGFE